MKAILVIDYTPSSCLECPCIDVEFRVCKAHEGYEEPSIYRRPDWCPLRPLPTKKVPVFDPNHCDIEKEILIIHEIDGYNRCLDEIMGETE